MRKQALTSHDGLDELVKHLVPKPWSGGIFQAGSNPSLGAVFFCLKTDTTIFF